MKLNKTIQKLLTKNTADQIVDEFISIFGFEKLMQMFGNRCIYRTRVKKGSKAWYRAARVFHKAWDEVKQEKAGKKVFKISRRDAAECPKCKHRFKMDAASENNCKFDLDRGMILVICPQCGFSE